MQASCSTHEPNSFDTSDMRYSVVLNLQVCFDVNHPTILHLGDLLQLEIPKPTTIRLNFNQIITLCCVEMEFFEIVLDCQEL